MTAHLFFEKNPIGDKKLPMNFVEGEVNTLIFPDGFFDDYTIPTLWNRDGNIYRQNTTQHFSMYQLGAAQRNSLVPESIAESVHEVFGEKVYFHFHSYFEINYVTQGNVYYIFDGQLIRAGTGDLVAINGDIPHAWIPDKRGETAVAKILVFMPNLLLNNATLRGESIHRFCRDFTWSHLTPDNPMVGKILRELCSIQTEFESKQAGYTDMILTHIIGVIVWLMRQVTMKKDEKRVEQDDPFYRIVDYIQKHITDQLSLTDVAKVAHMNPNYFCSYFKKKMGLSLGEYLRQLRLAKAVEYLLHSDHSITEIVSLAGFTSRTQFYRVFQNAYHMFPLEMRQQEQHHHQLLTQYINDYEEMKKHEF